MHRKKIHHVWLIILVLWRDTEIVEYMLSTNACQERSQFIVYLLSDKKVTFVHSYKDWVVIAHFGEIPMGIVSIN